MLCQNHLQGIQSIMSIVILLNNHLHGSNHRYKNGTGLETLRPWEKEACCVLIDIIH